MGAAVADRSGIEWTDATWNPTTGCDRVSPGCDHCYALTMAKRLKRMGSAKYQRDGDPRTSGPGFGITEHPDGLLAPLGWLAPRKVFVNSMSDLFHDGVSTDFLARVFAVMAATPRHIYQVLTKRHGRMRSLLSDPNFHLQVCDHASRMINAGQAEVPGTTDWMREPADDDATYWIPPWPLPNVWLGVSVESQQWADIRIPALLDTPAAVRWLSCEPLLGPVDLRCTACAGKGGWTGHSGLHGEQDADCGRCDGAGIWPVDWVVVGGESGPGARPMHPAWARSLRDQCVSAGVPFLFKQWGEWAPPRPTIAMTDGGTHVVEQDGRARPRLGEPLAAIAQRGAQIVARQGKKAAGRELDARTWDEYPQAWARRSREGAPNPGGGA